MRRAPSPLVLAALVVVAGCGGGTPQLTVSPAQAAEPVSGASQIVLEITNDGDGDDALIAAETDAAVSVEIHLTEVDDDGRATMLEQDEAELPAGETVRFRPGGLHLMMIAPDDDVQVGGTFPVTLEFERSDPITVDAEVVDLLDLAEPDAAEEDLDPDA